MRELSVNRFVGLGVLVAVAFGGLLALKSFTGNGVHETAPVASPAMNAPTPPASAPAATAAQAVATMGSLPSLNDSDPEMRKALSRLFGADAIDSYLRPNSIVRHIVAFVDSLPRKHIGSDSQPIKPIVGGFIATGDDQPTPLAPENAAKYTPYVAVISKVNPKLVSDLYFHFQPLFQQAYEELTKSDGRFDDRVLQAIDGLIDAPEIRDPVLVARRDAYYQFVDPNLEQLSVGQKFMIRLGPENAATLKSTLRALRESIVARSAP
jgi:hypothetical protein